MTGYRERSFLYRKRVLRLRERLARRGKRVGYLDESGVEPSGTRRYASAPKGQRVYGLSAGRSRPRTCLIAARLGTEGEEPFRVDGPGNAAVFNGWLERQLGPRRNENPVVVMDKVPFHNGAKTAGLIQGQGAVLLFLPPYSPAFKPIENDGAARKKTREYNEALSIDQLVTGYKELRAYTNSLKI